MSERPPWDDYFMKITHAVGERSTCLRRHVGAIIVKDKHILATGYNGGPAGLPHCDETGCLRVQLNVPSGHRQEICRALHAEQNAIIQAAQHGMSITGGVLYSTIQPCVTCAKMIINAGITRVVFEGDYPDEFAMGMMQQAKIELSRMGDTAALPAPKKAVKKAPSKKRAPRKKTG